MVMVSSVYQYFFSAVEPKQAEVVAKGVEPSEGVWHLIIGPTKCVLDWVQYVFGELTCPSEEYTALAGRVGRATGIFSIPRKLCKLAHSIEDWSKSAFKGLSWELGAKTTDVYIETSGTVSLAADTAVLGKEAGLYTLSPQQVLLIDYIGFMGSLALFASSLKGMTTHGHAFWVEEIGSVPFKLALMRLSGKVMLLSLSVFGMATFAYGSVVSRVTLMSISTFLLILSLFSHYYEKVCLKQLPVTSN